MAWPRDGLGLRSRRSSPSSYVSSHSPSLFSRSSTSLRLPKWRLANLFRWRLLRLVVTFFLCAALLRIVMVPFRRPQVPDYGPYLTHNAVLDPAVIDGGRQKLVIILPIDKPLHDLCKVVSSAVALGYPPPVLVNFRKEFHTGKAGVGPSHLAKVAGTLEFLDHALANETAEADRLNDDDLVIMLDALDIWFQLPPDVLLHRYYAVLEAASKRVEVESGFSDPSWMRQKIVVAAQKPCHGPRDDISDLHCDKAPESTLPDDIYGMFTDSLLMEIRWKWKRPRYLNSGSFMGPARDMRNFFVRVQEKLDRAEEMHANLGGDQAVFGEVFGEQEQWRRELQALHSEGDWAAERKKGREQDKWDFGLTLDYTQELFYPTSYSEHDGRFRTLSDAEAELQRAGGTSDMEDAKSPLAQLKNVPKEDLNMGRLSLFGDSWTGAVPAILHHNAWRFGLAQRRKTWWDKMWYFPYLRRLLEFSLDTKREMTPLATFPANNGSLEVWPYGAEKKDARKSSFILEMKNEPPTLRPAEWAEICTFDDSAKEELAPWYEEVFQDDGGTLKVSSG